MMALDHKESFETVCLAMLLRGMCPTARDKFADLIVKLGAALDRGEVRLTPATIAHLAELCELGKFPAEAQLVRGWLGRPAAVTS